VRWVLRARTLTTCWGSVGSINRALARAHSVELPRRDRVRAATRNASNLKMAFFRAYAAKCRMNAIAADREIWRIWLALHRHDCAGLVRKLAKRHPEFALTHRLAFYGGRTLAMLAAWRGRFRVLLALRELCGPEELVAEDDHGFTPLCFAAWAGNLRVVTWLVAQPEVGLAQLDAAGVPPLTSSCGGRGPFRADVWADRKGYTKVALAIRTARKHCVKDQA
jgi:hypothetical protein